MQKKISYEELEHEVRKLRKMLSANSEGASAPDQEAESKTVHSTKLLACTLDAVDSLLVVIDKDHRIVLCNWKDHEWVPEDIRDKKPYCYEVMKNLDSVCPHCPATLTLKDGKFRRFEDRNPVDGSYKSISVTPIFDADRKVEYVLESVMDITEIKRSEEALRESEERYRQLFEMESDAIILIDNETGQILEINRAASILYQYSKERLLSMKNTDLSAEPERTRKATEDGESIIPVRHHRKRDGTVFPVEITATHFAWQGREVHIAAIRDISFRIEAEKEKQELTRQLQQAQKMEALGTLAGGIAHNFNNLLMAIQGRASLMRPAYSDDNPDREHVDAIGQYVRSASGLTRQLLGLAREGRYEVRCLDVGKLLLQSAEMFHRTRKEIRIHSSTHPEPLVIEADRRQLEQVFLNIFINAWQAMPSGGEIYLESSESILDEAYCKPFGATPGRFAKISITDTGIGMDKETCRKAFDPFFTTKEKERGTGLGLSSAYGIVKKHEGIISIYSEVGRGATLNLYFPLSDREAELKTRKEEEIVCGGGTILLIDDEKMILEVGQGMLQRLGYRVIAANSGEQAVQTVSERGREIDLVILDMVMPGMDGEKTFEAIKKTNPDMPVLLSSGYSIDGQADRIMKSGCNGFIQKPFSLSDLSRQIRKVIDESGGLKNAPMG